MDNTYTTLIGSVYDRERDFEDVEHIIVGACGTLVPVPSTTSLKSSIHQCNALVFHQRTCEEARDERLKCFVTEWGSCMGKVRSTYNVLDVYKKTSSLTSFSIPWGKQEVPLRQNWRADSLHIRSDVLVYVSLSVPVVVFRANNDVTEF